MEHVIAGATHPDALAGYFARGLAAERRAGLDPFHCQYVMIAQSPIRSWLQLELARRHGHELGMDYVYPDEFIGRVLLDALRAADAAGKSAEPERALLPYPALHWMVAALLYTGRRVRGAPLPEAALRFFDAHAGVPRRPGKAPESALPLVWDWGRRLATLFHDYANQFPPDPDRPWWHRWRDEGGRGKGGRPEAYAQGVLAEAVLAPGGLRDHVDRALGKRWRLPHELAAELFARPDADERLREALGAGTLRVVGCEKIAPFQQHVIARFGRVLRVEILRMDGREPSPLPDPDPNDDVDANPDADGEWGVWRAPLAAVGAGWRRAFRAAGLPLAEIPVEAPSLPATSKAVAGAVAERPSRLDTLRRRLGWTPDGEAAAGWRWRRDDGREVDPSFQTWNAPSRRREVEAVAADLRAALATDPTLRPVDVAVFVPDFALYQADFAAVFDPRRGGPPYACFDADSAAPSALADGLATLFAAADRPVTRDSLRALAENALFRAAWGLPDDLAQSWRELADGLHVYHDRDPGENSADPHDWTAALTRLRLGTLMESAADRPLDEPPAEYGGRVPFAAPDGDDAAAGAFALAAETLVAFRRAARDSASSRKPSEWAARFVEIADRWLAPGPGVRAVAAGGVGRDVALLTAEKVALASWREKILTDSARADAILAALSPPGDNGNDGNGDGDDDGNGDVRKIPYEWARLALTAAAGARPTRKGIPLFSGLTAALLQIEHLPPARVTYILGLAENTWPEADEAAPLEVHPAAIRNGDGDENDAPSQRFGPVAWRTAAFRRAVLNTSDRLVLSRVGRDLRTGETFRPAPVWRAVERLLEPADPRWAAPAGPTPDTGPAVDPALVDNEKHRLPGLALSLPITPLEPAALKAAAIGVGETATDAAGFTDNDASKPPPAYLVQSLLRGVAAARSDQRVWRDRARRRAEKKAAPAAESVDNAEASEGSKAAAGLPPAGEAVVNVKLGQAAKFLREPLGLALRIGLEVDDGDDGLPDSEENLGREPLLADSYFLLNRRQEALARLLGEYAGGGGSLTIPPVAAVVAAPAVPPAAISAGNRYRDLLTEGVRDHRRRGGLPPAPFVDILERKVGAAGESDALLVEELFARALEGRWAVRPAVGYGRIPSHERADRHEPPLTLPPADWTAGGRLVRWHGCVSAHWAYRDANAGGKLIGVLPWPVAKAPKSKSPKELFGPWLAICLARAAQSGMVRAVGDEAAASPDRWLVELLPVKGKPSTWGIAAPEPAAARAYLSELARAMLADFRNDFLPYEWLLEGNLAEKALALAAPDAPPPGDDDEAAARALLSDMLAFEMEKTRNSKLDWLPSSARFTGYVIPSRPLALALKRFVPFWRALGHV